MFTSKLEAVYVQHYGSDLATVNSARVSFGKSTESLTDKDIKLINYLAAHEHMTPFEHSGATFIIKCPLYIRSQIHRHRTFAYNEISRRYTDENIEFYIPPVDDIRKQAVKNKQCSDGILDVILSQNYQQLIKDLCQENYNDYVNMIKIGIAREQARCILPQALMTEFWMTGSLRNWVHFLKLRLDAHAQSEVQYIAKEINIKLLELFPHSMEALMKENT